MERDYGSAPRPAQSGPPLPKLPGYEVHPTAPAAPKRQTLQYKNGYAVPLPLAHEQPGAGAAAPPAGAQWHIPAAPSAGACPPSTWQPKYVEQDKKVLRYFAYWVEEGLQSPEEVWRARKCVLLFYLEDDTLQVVEPQEPNSGLQQGTLIRRHNVPKEGGGCFGPADFAVGASVKVYGRQLHIVDADGFTRAQLAARGTQLAPALPYPTNPIEELRAMRRKPSGLTRNDDESPSKFAEALLGRESTSKKLQQFLEHGSHVLRFFCVWDDRQALHGDRRPFKLHYFLATDEVEIIEVLGGNSGRDFSTFLRRGPLPKVAVGCLMPGQHLSKEQCYSPVDFRVGAPVSVLGRELFIYDCDAFTRGWLQEHLGYGTEELAPVDISEPPRPLHVPSLPPWNGYGTLEDSQQNCVRLVPVPPKRDLYRALNKDRFCLRFACRLLEPEGGRLVAADLDRRFVLTFHMADETISVFEPPLPNSGRVTGKFLERGRVMRPGTTTAYSERDLWVGAELSLHGRHFLLQEADEYTYQYMENNASSCAAAADSQLALQALRGSLAPAGRAEVLLGALGSAGAELDGWMAALAGAGVALVPHQAITIFRRLRDAADGRLHSAALRTALGAL